MVLDPHRNQFRGTQRGDRHRASIVGVVLLRAASAQQPHPRRQRRGNVDNVFTHGEKLLSQQVAEPAGGLDRPDPIAAIEALGPLQQLRHLLAGGPHQPLIKDPLRGVDRHRSVGPLVRIDSDHDHR